MSNVDISIACGLTISAIKLSNFALLVFTNFTRLLNTSFRFGQYPNAVIPLFKKDNRQKEQLSPYIIISQFIQNLRENYVHEIIQFSRKLWIFLSLSVLFSSLWFYSYAVNLHLNKIYNALERGNEVRAVFLDISMAFDRVWHKGLIAKLRSIGINGRLLLWFEIYLKCLCHKKKFLAFE